MLPSPSFSPADLPGEAAGGRAFTVKALTAGLLGGCALCALAIYNSDRLRQPNFLGSHFPAAAVCYVLLLGTAWNLLWSRLRPRAVFSPRELLVVLGCCFAASGVAVHGLFRTFYTSLVLPWVHLSNKPAWARHDLLGQLPAELFPLGGRMDDSVYGGFVQGMGAGAEIVAPWALPWAAWAPVLLRWAPLVACLLVAWVGLSLVLHRQWARHEQLAYPLAGVLSALVQRGPGRAVADLFHSRLFWGGFLPVFGLQLYNLVETWVPELWPRVETVYYLNWDALYRILPTTKSTGFFSIHEIKLFFFIFGITYFLPSAIGFSLGISQLLLLAVSTQVFLATGSPLGMPQLELQRSGAFLGYALVLAFAGRTYYLALVKAAFGFRAESAPPESVWAARLFLGGAAGFWALLTWQGLDWVVAGLFTGLLVVLFAVVSRLICETGLPILQAAWQPGGFLLHALGPAALGAKPLIFVQWLSTLFANDTREAALPYLATSLKCADDAGLRLRSYAKLLLVALVVAVVAAGISRLSSLYNFGAVQDPTLFGQVTTQNLDAAARALDNLGASGDRPASDAARGLAKLGLANVSSPNLPFALYGALAVVLLAALRWRFLNWPLHPVFLMVWGTDAFKNLAYCFLAGWIVKVAVVRLGGGKVYQTLKPLFLGVVLGDVVAAGCSLTGGFIYHVSTGLLPRTAPILPDLL